MTTASVFTGIRLGNESRKKLLDTARKFLGVLYPKISAQHIVLKFRGNPEKIPAELMGKMVEFQITTLREGPGVQIATLSIPPLLERLEWGAKPYILIAHTEDAKSVPVQAKSLARGKPRAGDIEFVTTYSDKVTPALHLRGEIGFVHDRIGWVFSHLSEADMAPLEKKSRS